MLAAEGQSWTQAVLSNMEALGPTGPEMDIEEGEGQVRIRVSLPVDLLAEIRALCDFEHRTVSSFLAESADRRIQSKRAQDGQLDLWLTQTTGQDGRRHLPLAARSLGVTPLTAPIETKTPASPSAENPSPDEEEAD
jgi:hypothetical protein